MQLARYRFKFIVVGVCAAVLVFVFTVHTDKTLQASPTITGMSNRTISTYAPEFNQTVEVSYSSEFVVQLNQISTVDWPTYKSSFGYQIKYPPDWEVFSCMGGTQVFFYDNSVPEVCDSANEGADFTIIGPTSQRNEQALATPARLIETFDLNGFAVTRYLDSISGPSGYDLMEDVQLEIHGKYLDLYVGNTSRTLWDERMLTTFKVDT